MSARASIGKSERGHGQERGKRHTLFAPSTFLLLSRSPRTGSAIHCTLSQAIQLPKMPENRSQCCQCTHEGKGGQELRRKPGQLPRLATNPPACSSTGQATPPPKTGKVICSQCVNFALHPLFLRDSNYAKP